MSDQCTTVVAPPTYSESVAVDPVASVVHVHVDNTVCKESQCIVLDLDNDTKSWGYKSHPFRDSDILLELYYKDEKALSNGKRLLHDAPPSDEIFIFRSSNPNNSSQLYKPTGWYTFNQKLAFVYEWNKNIQLTLTPHLYPVAEGTTYPFVLKTHQGGFKALSATCWRDERERKVNDTDLVSVPSPSAPPASPDMEEVNRLRAIIEAQRIRIDTLSNKVNLLESALPRSIQNTNKRLSLFGLFK